MTIPDSQLRYGSVITLQNGYESYQGGYLYTSGRARTPWSLWDVSTSKDAVDGIKGSTFWRIMSAENKTPGEKVCYGDVLILQNGYNYWKQGGYLYTSGDQTTCPGALWDVATLAQEDDSGKNTTHWTILPAKGSVAALGDPVTDNAPILLQNGYLSEQGGGYLFTCGDAITPWSLWDVSTQKGPYDGNKKTSDWKPILPETPYWDLSHLHIDIPDSIPPEYAKWVRQRDEELNSVKDPKQTIALVIHWLRRILQDRRNAAAQWVTSPENPDVMRPEIVIFLSYQLFDFFFNSPAGIRGQYAVSVERGDWYNQRFIQILQNDLLPFFPSERQAQVAQSLQHRSATAWLNEANGLPGIPGPSNLFGTDEAFPNPHWKMWEDVQDQDPITSILQLPAADIRQLAGFGQYVPERQVIRIHGAWIDGEGNPWVPPSQTTRGLQISMLGYSHTPGVAKLILR